MREQEIPDELKSFEARLRLLQPGNVSSDADAAHGQAMYQCGWQAALADASKPVVRQRQSWHGFAGGAVAGIVAAWLTVICMNRFEASPNKPERSMVASAENNSAASVAISPAQRMAPELDDLDAELAKDLAKLNLSGLFASLFSTTVNVTPPAFDQASTKTIASSAALSQAAQRTWGQLLGDTGEPSAASGRNHQSHYKSLGEMMQDFINPHESTL